MRFPKEGEVILILFPGVNLLASILKDTNDIQDKLDGNKQNVEFSSSSSGTSSSSSSDEEDADQFKKDNSKPKAERQKKDNDITEKKTSVEQKNKTKETEKEAKDLPQQKKNLIVLAPVEESANESSNKNEKNSDMSFQVSEFHS